MFRKQLKGSIICMGYFRKLWNFVLRRDELSFVSTGMTALQVRNEQNKMSEGMSFVPRCYVCKRIKGEGIFLISSDKSGKKPIIVTVSLVTITKKIKSENKRIKVKFMICCECASLFGLKAE